MKTKLRFLWVLLALLLGGANGAWAATYKLAVQTISSNNDAYESVNGGAYGALSYFSLQTPYNINAKFRDAAYDGLTFTHGIKMESDNKGAISFTTGSTSSTVTIVQSTHSYDNNSYSSNTNTIKFDETVLAITDASFTGDGEAGNKYRVYTILNVTAGSHSISRNSGESGIFYVCVEESSDKATLTTFAFNHQEVVYQGANGNLYINKKGAPQTSSDPFKFTYDASYSTIKTKLILDPGLTTIGASATSTYFTVESNNDQVLDVSSVSYSQNTAGDRIYVDGIQVKEAGTATLTYHFRGSEIYDAIDCSVTINVKPAITTYSNSYPFTWDFTSATSWEGSNLQANYYYSNWTYNGTFSSYQSTQNSVSANNGIDKIRGLAFASLNIFGENAYSLFLDPNAGQIAMSGQVTVPNLTTDYQVVFTGTAGMTITPEGGSKLTESPTGTYVYTPTTTGDVTFAISDVSKAISTIQVRKPLYTGVYTYSTSAEPIDGEVRKLKGTYSFTGEGGFTSGATISDVPGITATFTKGNNDLHVVTVSNSNHYEGTVLMSSLNTDKGATITFTPSVNGFLSLQGNFYAGTKINDGSSDIWSASINTYYKDITEITTPLIAGKTYVLSGGAWAWELHAFSFRPAFLDPTTTPAYASEQTATFPAHSNTTAFPKLVNDASAGVRFSGNRSVVNLSNDGGVTLVGKGEAIVRGTVISGEHDLVAYYTLNANVLSLSSTTPESGSTITTLDNNSFLFVFDENIALASDATSKVVVMKDADVLSGISVELAGSTIPNYEKTLKISNFPSPLEAGSTYTIRVKAGCVYKDGNVNIANPEVIETFTITSEEPPLTWIYPTTTSAVRIGSSIVLQTSAKIDEGYPSNGVYGTLTYEGDDNDSDYPMVMKAIKDDKNLVFKPTKPMIQNKLYKLTVDGNQVKLAGNNNTIEKDKVYMFTTGAATGDTPILSSSIPADGSIIDLPTSNTKVMLNFDQNVDLEPYSLVTIWPVNGDEDLSKGYSDKLVSGVLTPQNMTVDTENPKQVSFDIGSDIKYDLYYELKIPANTVTGPGGMPNNAKTVLFKINRNPNSHEVEKSSFYPHTWDFNKFGKDDNSDGVSSSIEMIKANTNSTIDTRNDPNNPTYDAKNAFVYSSYDSGLDYVCNNKNGYGFDQGNDIYIATSATEKYVLPEFHGIRVSTKNQGQSKRFAIRNTETKNADNSDKFIFRMNGNTHYMTLSNVPAGKLYMVVNSRLLGINSPNASFENNAVFGQTTHDDMKDGKYTRITNTNGTKKLVLNVSEAGDVSFCVGNFSCEKIGVAKHEKTFRSDYAESDKTYATDRLTYDVRYDLLNAFTDHDVKAYYVSSMADNAADNTATITATEVTGKVAMADKGVMVLYQGEVSSSTTVPIFKTDVNSPATEAGNQLKVINSGSTSLPSIGSDYYMYVLSNKGARSSGISFYRYTGSTFSDRAAYLEVPKSWVEPASGAGARAFRLVFQDEDGSETTAIRPIETAGISEYFEQDGNIYNLRGMRVEKPSKHGLYIKGGKKVYMK